jgi:hypothetical protein
VLCCAVLCGAVRCGAVLRHPPLEKGYGTLYTAVGLVTSGKGLREVEEKVTPTHRTAGQQSTCTAQRFGKGDHLPAGG